MPKTKTQGIIFGLLMSYTMAYGMEVYNIGINEGVNLLAGGFSNMSNEVFLDALIEASYMGIFVFIFSSLWGNRMGEKFMLRHFTLGKDHPYLCQIMRQAGTVAIMCPTMSLFASLFFNIFLAKATIIQLPAIFVGTLIKNFPIAFFWNMFAAAPLTHFVFTHLFKNNQHIKTVS